MTLVGFQRSTIVSEGIDGAKISDVIEGKTNKGATTTAEITGLSKDAVSVPGSNITYFVSQKGLGEVKANLGLLDLPYKISDRILGYENEGKLTYMGNSSEPPYVSLILESATLQGDAVVFVFYRGKFSLESNKLETLDPKENFTPEAEDYVFTAAAADIGDQAGQTIARFIGKKDDPDYIKLMKQVYGDTWKSDEVPPAHK